MLNVKGSQRQSKNLLTSNLQTFNLITFNLENLKRN